MYQVVSQVFTSFIYHERSFFEDNIEMTISMCQCFVCIPFICCALLEYSVVNIIRSLDFTVGLLFKRSDLDLSFIFSGSIITDYRFLVSSLLKVVFHFIHVRVKIISFSGKFLLICKTD